MHSRPDDPDVALAADALGIEARRLTMIGREPLGAGSVTGFAVEGEQGAVTYLDTSMLAVARETGLAQEGVGRLWIHPADPHLPALAPAAYGRALAILLDRLGVVAAGEPEIVAYRPGRRAVLRVRTRDGGTAWVKVVRPSRVQRIVDLHRALAAHDVPVPAIVGWSPEGLLVLAEAVGAPALAAVADDEAAADGVLDGIERLRDTLSRAPLPGKARASVVTRIDWYASRLGSASPDAGGHVDAIVAALGRRREPSGAAVGIHGDLHLGQLFIARGGDVSGVIDVDTAGLGAPGDDIGALVGHAVASAALTAPLRDPSSLWRFASAAWRRWGDEPGAAACVAVQLMGHALSAVDADDRSRADGLLRVAGHVVQGLDAGEPKDALMKTFESA